MHALPARTLVTLHLNLFLHSAAEQAKRPPGEWPPAIQTGISAAALTRYELRPSLDTGFEQSVIFARGERSYEYSLLSDAAGVHAFMSFACHAKTTTPGLVGGGVSAR
jgi:hypothetical protein